MKKLLLIFVSNLLIYSTAFAQKYYNDAQVRLNIGLEKRISKKFSLSLEQQDRFTKNISDFSRASLEFGLHYKLNKHIKFKVAYTLVSKENKYGYFENKNWYSAAVTFKQDIRNWKFLYKNMFQARMNPKNSDEYSIVRYYDRNKFTIKHQTTRRVGFWLAEELYIPLNNIQSQGIDRSRTFIGTEIKLTKTQSVELYFMYQAQLQRGKWYDQNFRYQNDPYKRYYIYGIDYKIDF